MNYELGMIWEGQGGTQIGLTAYHTRFKDMIDRTFVCGFSGGPLACADPGGSGAMREWVRQYSNVASASAHGLEASLDHSFGDVDLSATYTYAYRRDDTTGQRLTSLPEHVVNLRLDWQATEKLGLWTVARYRSETEEGNAGTKVPDYATLDLGMSYRVGDHVTAFAGLTNALDKRVETYNPTSGALVDGKIIDGQTFFFGLTSSF